MRRPHAIFTAVFFLLACREPDLQPLRGDLSTSAAIVCAAPVARPPHAARTRDVQPAEVEAAIVRLCTDEAAHVDAAAEPLAVLHEALVQERAITGDLRQNRMLLDLPRIDLAALRPDKDGVRTAEETLAKASAGPKCGPSWPGLDRYMLAAAVADSKAGRSAVALERCADVVALARDEDLAGNLTDVMLANSSLQRAVTMCMPLVDTAPKDAAAKLASSLTTLRTTFPATLDDVLRRDRAGMILFTFGKGRDPATKLPCERASALAAAGDGKPLTRGEKFDLSRLWNETRRDDRTADPKYLEAYTLTLRVLDTLIERAKSR